MKVFSKLPTIVPTPTLTASASSSAISASDRPDSCWRLSAQAHSATGRREACSPSAQHDAEQQRQQQRRAEQDSGEHGKSGDQALAERETSRSGGEAPPARPPCHTSQRCCASCQANGCADTSNGIRRTLISACAAATSAPATLMRKPGKPPLRRDGELAGDACAVEPAQARGHVGQQRRRDQIAADDAARACKQREQHKFDDEHRHQSARRHAARAQGAQHRQPLLERKAHGRMDDEQPDQKRQQAKRRQVEMKARREPLEIGLGAGLDEAQVFARDLAAAVHVRSRPPRIEQETRDTIRRLQDLLREADVHHQQIRRKTERDMQRRQRAAVFGRKRVALARRKLPRRFRTDQRLAARRKKILQRRSPTAGAGPAPRGKLIGSTPMRRTLRPADTYAALDHRRHQPAGAAQIGEQRLRHARRLRRHQHRRVGAAERAAAARS